MDSSTISSSSSGDSADGELVSLRLKSSSRVDLQSLFENERVETSGNKGPGLESPSPVLWVNGGPDRLNKGSDFNSEEIEHIRVPVRQETVNDSVTANEIHIKSVEAYVDPSDETEYDPFVDHFVAGKPSLHASPNTKKHFRVSKTVRFRDWEKAPIKTPLKPALKTTKKKKRHFFHRSKGDADEERVPSSEYSQTPETSNALINQDVYHGNKHHLAEFFNEPPSSMTEASNSLFSNKDNQTNLSSAQDNVEANAGQELDPTLTLVSGLNKLTLDAKNEEDAWKGFSLRLGRQENNYEDDLKSNRNSTPEASFEQIDILDQNPPNLPEISKNFIPNTEDLSIPSFDSLGNLTINELTKSAELLKGIATELSTPLNQKVDTKTLSTLELLEKIEELSKLCFDKINSYKVQQIKLQKQLNDDKQKIEDYLSNECITRDEINSLQSTINSLIEKCSKYESEIISQSQKLSSERSQNEVLEDNLKTHLKLIASLESQVKYKSSFISDIHSLLNTQFESECDLDLLASLKLLVQSFEELKKYNLTITKQDKQQKNLIESLNSSLKTEIEEKINLQKAMSSTTMKLMESQERLTTANNENEQLALRVLKQNEEIISLTKENESLNKNLENEQSQLIELDQKIIDMENSKIHLSSKVEESEMITAEQLKLIEDLKSKLDEQSKQINLLKNQISFQSEEKLQIKAFNDTLSYELDLMTTKLNNKTEEFESLKHHSEVISKSRNNTIKQKDDELKILKTQIEDFKEKQSQHESELSEVKLRLSDKINDNNNNLKKIESVSKKLNVSQESNRSLRSDILHISHIKQELKRTFVDLSVNLIKEFDGLIDDVSLVTVKESLSLEKFLNLSDEKHIEKLNDISVFIEEALSLIVKEHWSLTKRLSDSQKLNLSNSSMGALQRINSSQSHRLTKLEKKLQHYEQILKRINFINERPSTTVIGRKINTRSSRHVSNENQDLSDSENSIKSSISLDTLALREKQSEINKLISKANRKNLDY